MKMATWVKSYDHLKPNEAKKGVWHPCGVYSSAQVDYYGEYLLLYSWVLVQLTFVSPRKITCHKQNLITTLYQ